MEKHNLVMNGGFKLPIGYRFHPTDEEILLHYLKRKVHAIPLPASVIPEFDVFHTDPWALPGDVKEKRYFFCNQKRDLVNNKICKKKAAGSGYWKPIGKDKLIVASELHNQAVGVRRSLVFRGRKRPQDAKTRWFMHEYHLVRTGTAPNSVQLMSQMEMKEYWVVCGVFQKKRRPRKQGVVSELSTSKRKQITMEVTKPCYMDMEFTVEDISNSGPPTPSFSCSSEVTEVLANVDDDQEESSRNSYSYCSREP